MYIHKCRKAGHDIVVSLERARLGDIALTQENIVHAVVDIDQAADTDEEFFKLDAFSERGSSSNRQPSTLPEVAPEVDNRTTGNIQSSPNLLIADPKTR